MHAGVDDKADGRVAVADVRLAGERAIGGAGEDGDVARVFDGIEVTKEKLSRELQLAISLSEEGAVDLIERRARNMRELAAGRDAVGINPITCADINRGRVRSTAREKIHTAYRGL